METRAQQESRRDAAWHRMITSFIPLHCRQAMEEVIEGSDVKTAVEKLGKHGIWGVDPWPQRQLEKIIEDTLKEVKMLKYPKSDFEIKAQQVGMVRLSKELGCEA